VCVRKCVSRCPDLTMAKARVRRGWQQSDHLSEHGRTVPKARMACPRRYNRYDRTPGLVPSARIARVSYARPYSRHDASYRTAVGRLVPERAGRRAAPTARDGAKLPGLLGPPSRAILPDRANLSGRRSRCKLPSGPSCGFRVDSPQCPQPPRPALPAETSSTPRRATAAYRAVVQPPRTNAHPPLGAFAGMRRMECPHEKGLHHRSGRENL
jgi:hypothetical protein